MSRFSGVGVLVTGASRGLGADIALAFGAEGAWVGVGYRVQVEQAEATLDAVRAAGGDGCCLALDLRKPDSIRAAVDAFEEHRPLDVLVNNAGVVHDQPFVMITPEAWGRVIDANLSGTYAVSRAVLPRMLSRRRGVIVNVSSVSALRAVEGQSAYAASKAGVQALTRSLAREVAGRGVRVNAVIPGLLDTGMGQRLDHVAAERHRAQIPMGRFGSGEEVARAVLYLASHEASYVVGAALTVDGGLTL